VCCRHCVVCVRELTQVHRSTWSWVQVGFGEFQVSMKRGQRADAFVQFLRPALGRPNLKVVTSARTTHVATEQSAGGVKAVGVEFAVDGPQGKRHAGELQQGRAPCCLVIAVQGRKP